VVKMKDLIIWINIWIHIIIEKAVLIFDVISKVSERNRYSL